MELDPYHSKQVANSVGLNPLLPDPPKTALSQSFLNLLSNQAWTAKLAAQSWFTEDSRTTD